ncbi:LysE family translocator [Jhaorihella thermophila]
MDTPLLLFLGVSAIVIMTPGQDTALSLRNTMAGGRSAGIATAAGVATGQLIWAVSAALGLVAILAAADTLFAAIKYAGAAYLIFLGIQSLKAALRGTVQKAGRDDLGAIDCLSTTKAFTQGIVSNLGNPKMAIFLCKPAAAVCSPRGTRLRGNDGSWCSIFAP